MALLRALTPVLVLCAPCREGGGFNDRLAALADPESGALLVRDVCAAADCPELQLRGHLCADHILDYELAWQHLIPVRACHGCRQSMVVLARDQCDVWCVLPRSGESRAVVRSGVAVRYMDMARLKKSIQDEPVFQSPVRAAKGKARAKLSSGKKRMRRSARTLQQICERERMRALEWSLGNFQVKQMFLWKENAHRRAAEKALDSGSKGPVVPEPPGAPQPDPDEPVVVFCRVPKCRFFAKSGECCRFHSPTPLAPLAVRIYPNASTPTGGMASSRK